MADESNKVVAEVRDSFGKGAARKIRAAGKIPAVIYGHGTDPQHVTLPAPPGRPHPAQGERGARPRHRGHEPARPCQGCAEGPGAPDHRAPRPDRRPQAARRSTSRCPCTSRASPFSGTIAVLDVAHDLARGRGHPHPGAHRRRRRGRSTTAPSHRAKDFALPEGASWPSDPDLLIINVRSTRPPARAEDDEPRPAEAAERAEAAEAGGVTTAPVPDDSPGS